MSVTLVEKAAVQVPGFAVVAKALPRLETPDEAQVIAPVPETSAPTVFERVRGAMTPGGVAVVTILGIASLFMAHDVGVALVATGVAGTGVTVAARSLGSTKRERAAQAEERAAMAQERAELTRARHNFEGAVREAARELVGEELADLASKKKALEREQKQFDTKSRKAYSKVGSPEHLAALAEEAKGLTTEQRKQLSTGIGTAHRTNIVFALATTSDPSEGINAESLPASQVLGSLVAKGRIYAGVACKCSWQRGMKGVYHGDHVTITSVRDLLNYVGVKAGSPEAAAEAA